MNNWIDNETWYNHQYLQHFQVSPATSGSSSHSDVVQLSIGNDDHEDENEENTDQSTITFASLKDKAQILAYLANGHTLEDAERVFDIPQRTIRFWLDASNPETAEKVEKESVAPEQKFESAFYKPSWSLYKQKAHQSAFAHYVNKDSNS